MKIYIGSDHGGFELKQALVPFLIDLGHEVDDQGTDSSASVDYPNYAKKVGQAVVADKGSLGIVICGTGIGISIAANKVYNRFLDCIGYNGYNWRETDKTPF